MTKDLEPYFECVCGEEIVALIIMTDEIKQDTLYCSCGRHWEITLIKDK